MRRLPVFFLIDCSESMVGESIDKVEAGLEAFVKLLRADPYALETVAISVIAFAGISKVITPLIDIASFYPPRLPIGDGTCLGRGLDCLMDELDTRVLKTTIESKGDWKPLVYLLTDGRPTEDPSQSISRWKKSYADGAKLISISLGREADFDVLEQISEEVLVFEDTQENDFKKFIEWVSASVSAQSQSLGVEHKEAKLPQLPPGLSLAKGAHREWVDDVSVTLVGRCQSSRKPYLIKYDRNRKTLKNLSFSLDVSRYHLSACYPLSEDYFEWSGTSLANTEVHTDRLDGVPSCPHCGNATAFAVCGCGKLLCTSGPGVAVCPWCDTTIEFNLGSVDSGDGFSVRRGKG